MLSIPFLCSPFLCQVVSRPHSLPGGVSAADPGVPSLLPQSYVTGTGKCVLVGSELKHRCHQDSVMAQEFRTCHGAGRVCPVGCLLGWDSQSRSQFEPIQTGYFTRDSHLCPHSLNCGIAIRVSCSLSLPGSCHRPNCRESLL